MVYTCFISPRVYLLYNFMSTQSNPKLLDEVRQSIRLRLYSIKYERKLKGRNYGGDVLLGHC